MSMWQSIHNILYLGCVCECVLVCVRTKEKGAVCTPTGYVFKQAPPDDLTVFQNGVSNLRFVFLSCCDSRTRLHFFLHAFTTVTQFILVPIILLTEHPATVPSMTKRN